MKTKINLFYQYLSRIFLCAFAVVAILLVGCQDDPEPTNEEEVITTFIVTLTPSAGPVVTLSWDDIDLDGVIDLAELISSGSLAESTTYSASLQLWNKSADPDIDITEEITEEANDHIFCFTVSGVNIVVTERNLDSNGLPVGLTSTWTTTTSGTGTVNIKLRHQPGIKTGECPGPGDSDADITFTVEIDS